LAVKQCPQAGLPHTSDRHLGRTFHGRRAQWRARRLRHHATQAAHGRV